MTEKSPIIDGMLTIHKIITRGIRVSIGKCYELTGKQGILPGETKGLSMFTTTLKWVIHSHHLTEDEIVFPYFKNRIEAPYERLGNDHQAMSVILDQLDKCIPDISTAGAGKLWAVLGELNTLWEPHIKIEEETFSLEKVHAVSGMQEQVNLANEFSRHSRDNSGPGPMALPFLFYNLEGKNREDFLMMFPWIIKKVIVPYVWRNQWKPMDPFLLI
jgi:hypothetical protein